MEVAGLVIGIVSLYSASQSCYALYTDTREAKDDFRAALHDLEIHRAILRAWAAYWEIQADAAVQLGETAAPDRDGRKLKLYLRKYPDKARGIASALIRTADVLLNGKKLGVDYGLETNLDIVLPADDTETEGRRLPDRLTEERNWTDFAEEIRRKVDTFSSRITFGQKFKWALKDQTKFKALIAELKKYNDALHLLGPDFAFEILQMSLALELFGKWDETDLRLLHERRQQQHPGQQDSQEEQREPAADVSGSNAPLLEQPSASPSDEGTQILGDLAEIALAVAVAASSRQDVLSDEDAQLLLSIQADKLDVEDPFETHSMAVWRGSERNEAVLVDNYPYGRQDGLKKRIRTSILRLGQLLMLPSCSKHMGTLELIGMAEDTVAESIMLVYRLPATLGLHRPRFPVYDMAIRKPQDAIPSRRHYRSHDLGSRFELARKLVRSVAFLHACGWLHKNIRTHNLIRFPKDGPTLSRDYDKMDFENAFLRGFECSRQDDIREDTDGQPPPTPTPQPDVVHRNDTSPHRTANTSSSVGSRGATTSVHVEGHSSRDSDLGSDVSYSGEAGRINLDFRHHPYKRAYPDRVYRHAFDVYSLGIALFEIGMGKDIKNILPDEIEHTEPYEARRVLVAAAEDRLPAACGNAYTKAVLFCLNIDQEDFAGETVAQRKICEIVAVQLDQCRA